MSRTFAFAASLLSLAVAAGHGCGFQSEPGDGSDVAADSLEADEVHQDEGLARETIAVADERGNSVTLLVTSTDREELARFLDNTDISVEALGDFMRPYSGDRVPTPSYLPEEEHPDSAEEDSVSDGRLRIKVLARHFAPGTEALTVSFRGKEILSSSGPIAPSNLSPIFEHESNRYEDGFMLDYASINCDSCNKEIVAQHWSRPCGLCRFNLHAERRLSPGESWYSCNEARRTKAIIFGHEPAPLYNFSLTFWNCA